MELSEALRTRIMELCGENKLTLHGLAAVCGMNQSTLDNIVSGRNKSTTISTLQKICDGLEIDLPTFFHSDLFRNLK